jgi:uncharacterized repeat protein (TIGR02543 family)
VDWEGAKHFRFWRARHDDGSYSPWRVAIWDFDLAFSESRSTLNMLQLALDPSGTVDFHDRDLRGDPDRSLLIRALLENESFRQQFINRFADLMNTLYTSEHMIKTYNQRFEVIYPYVPEHVSRWERQFSQLALRRRYQLVDPYLPRFMRRWGAHSALEETKLGPGVMSFMRDRAQDQRKHIVDFFNLRGQVELEIDWDRSSGDISINSIELHDHTAGVGGPGAWRGRYFKDVPVTVTARAKPGYRFQGWEAAEGIASSSESMVFNPQNDLRLRAIFSAIGP